MTDGKPMHGALLTFSFLYGDCCFLLDLPLTSFYGKSCFARVRNAALIRQFRYLPDRALGGCQKKMVLFLTVCLHTTFDFCDLDSIAAMTPQMIEMGHRTNAARPAVNGTRMTAQMVRNTPPAIVA